MQLRFRGLIRPTGLHRAAPPTGSLFPTAPASHVVTQGFRHCPPCGTDTVSVLHRTSHTCGDCGTTHYPEEV
ncbi:hypothetical protein ACFRLW_18385 [Streptomyces sp. NPDC056728]